MALGRIQEAFSYTVRANYNTSVVDLRFDKRDIVLTCEGHEWKIGFEVR